LNEFSAAIFEVFYCAYKSTDQQFNFFLAEYGWGGDAYGH